MSIRDPLGRDPQLPPPEGGDLPSIAPDDSPPPPQPPVPSAIAPAPSPLPSHLSGVDTPLPPTPPAIPNALPPNAPTAPINVVPQAVARQATVSPTPVPANPVAAPIPTPPSQKVPSNGTASVARRPAKQASHSSTEVPVAPVRTIAAQATEVQPAEQDVHTEDELPHEGGWVGHLKEIVSKLALESAPPWLISTLVHLIVIIGLALYYLPSVVKSPFVLEVAYGEELGEQMLDDMPFMDSIETLETEPALALDTEAVEDPLASLPEVNIKLDLLDSSPDLVAPTPGIALSGREKGAKRALLAAYGGTGETEGAVTLALGWLRRQQQSDGTWKLDGPYSDGVLGIENRLAATAMALLAFQGSGSTHLDGEYASVVKKGKDALLRMQDGDGSFFATQGLVNHHQLYSQAQATIAICELYGMTKDPELREPAQRALDYSVSIQATSDRGGGGWRYDPGQGVDTSVTGWFVMALQSGRMAQLDVSQEALDQVSEFLDSVTTDGVRHGYRPGEDPRISMTAEALLCRQYLGWSHSDGRLLAGVQRINDNPINWEEPHVYYWYYATQVVHHMGGEAWETWNRTMRKTVPKAQVKTGRERGSWSPAGDLFGARGGRLYMTCFCVYMLEVYYRHLPIYQH